MLGLRRTPVEKHCFTACIDNDLNYDHKTDKVKKTAINLEAGNEELNKRLQFVCDLFPILSDSCVEVLAACSAEASLTF